MARVRHLKNSWWRNEAWENSLILRLWISIKIEIERERGEEKNFNIIKFFNITRDNYIVLLLRNFSFVFYRYWQKYVRRKLKLFISLCYFSYDNFSRYLFRIYIRSNEEEGCLRESSKLSSTSKVGGTIFLRPFACKTALHVYFLLFLSFLFPLWNQPSLKERTERRTTSATKRNLLRGGEITKEASPSTDAFLKKRRSFFLSFVVRNNFMKSCRKFGLQMEVRDVFFFFLCLSNREYGCIYSDKKRREKYMITYTIRNFITPLIDELAGAQG